MAELKTKATKQSVEKYINEIEHKTRHEDAKILLSIMTEVTNKPAIMWGKSIVGFDKYHYEYDSGCKGDWMKIGFSVQKSKLSIYLINGFSSYGNLLAKLGKHKLGKSCLYINKLADIDLDILKELTRLSYKHMCEKYI